MLGGFCVVGSLLFLLLSSSPDSQKAVYWLLQVHPVLHILLPISGNDNDAQYKTGDHRRLLEGNDATTNLDLASSLADSGANMRVFGPALEKDVDFYQVKDGLAMAWFTPSSRRQFLQANGHKCWTESTEDVLKHSGNAVVQRYDELEASPFLQTEIWKFCMFATGNGNVYWDREQVVPLLLWQDIWEMEDTSDSNKDRSTALLVNHNNHADNAISASAWVHSSFLRLDGNNYAKTLSEHMLRLLLETEDSVLTSNPLYTYRALAQHIQNDDKIQHLWQTNCQVPSTQHPADHVLVQQPKSNQNMKQSARKRRNRNVKEEFNIPPEFTKLPTFGLHCTIPGGYCCQVWNPAYGNETPVFMVKHPFGTTGGLTKTPAIITAEKQHFPSNSDSTWSTITSVPNKVAVVPSKLETPNFFDILLQNNCLPTSQECRSCLKKATSSAGCDDQCAEDCPCYCKVLCHIRPPPKHVQAVWYVSPPLYQQQTSQPQRLIPRIIHQTWYEPLDQEKYPNMSRLMSSWKHSGWQHNFYDDATAAKFLEKHFPSQVLEAYNAIQPGAFKADLFRYCVLLIQGGVYADMDVLLETNLELAIDPDVGFMTPIDEPGIRVKQQSCLWNGFMAVAPGHPFVAKTIEIVVNNIRNRFTSVDYDDMLCPGPILSTSHSFDILFTTGPCILGTAMNMILQRHPQTGFAPGELDIWGGSNANEEGQKKQQRQRPPMIEPNDPRLAIPGRSIILRQNKQDMGAHRFTLDEKNLIMCSTDMPEYDDRPKKPHYAESGKLTPLYGTTKLYSDTVAANEEIRVVVVGNANNFTL
ncbi:glycosyltransferase [Seminavis robusta]|uniref:Glycosyltransferase n=1 Tax=Seminavis robusta TaxID=568900 RepID=A0A9N8DCF2_9STRA|nr:glycosyltransferase [Seminavis robusta]|eukprot:Sro80_g043010.1 glycosyltransferase (811) ;mRNA; r:42633-45243